MGDVATPLAWYNLLVTAGAPPEIDDEEKSLVLGLSLSKRDIKEPVVHIDEFGVKARYLEGERVVMIFDHEYKSDDLAIAKFTTFKSKRAVITDEGRITSQSQAQLWGI